MKSKYFAPIIALLLSSCATMNESLELGAAMGAVTGAGAAAIGHTANTGEGASLGTVAAGAGIGLAAGLITSYFTHKSVEANRASLQADQTDMYFGDLPPSPFLVPKIPYKKGVK